MLKYCRFSTLWIYRALSKSSADYVFCCTGTQITPAVKKKWSQLLLEEFRKIFSLRRLEVWKCLFMKLPFWCLGVKPVRLMIVGGEDYLNYNHFYKCPVNKNTEFLQTHTFDYDLYLKERDTPYAEKPMAVFLDEFLPFHPDFIILEDKPSESVDRYYPLLNSFFDRVEKETRLEVVIAVHPRSNYENHPDYYNGRKCIRGETVNLIKDCRVVLSHGSTAFQFANLFYKPVIFMTWPDLDKTYDGFHNRQCAKFFGKQPIYINENNNIDWEQELKVDKDCYDDYRRRYIKTEKSEDLLFWQIVANRLKEGFK